MKTLIATLATVAVLAGFGANDAKAENFFKKMSKQMEKAHERHVEMLLGSENDRRRDNDDRGRRDRHGNGRRGARFERGQRGFGEGCGHYEMIEVQVLVAASWKIEYVTVQDPGHYEYRDVEHVTPGYHKNVWVEAVYTITRDHCGKEIKVLVKAGHWEKVWVPEVRCTTREKVWVEGECRQVAKKVCVPAHYETKCVRVWVCD